MKRIISLFLAAVMLFSLCYTTAYAEENTPKTTFHYVALGDSITAGFALENKTDDPYKDPALVVTQDLIDHPIQSAYPALFGNHIAELGQQNGYSVSTTNLGSCAYRAEDVSKTILEKGYKGEIANRLLGNHVNQYDTNPLSDYHDIYNAYLPDADLITIQLGANDLIMGVIEPLTKEDNPILQAIARSATQVFIGVEPDDAMQQGLTIIENNLDKIDYHTVTEALTFFTTINSRAEDCIETAAANVSGVIDTVSTVNSNADLAVIGIMNPYGNSLEYEGQVQTLYTIVTNIFTKSIAQIADGKEYQADPEIVPDAQLEDKAEAFSDHVLELIRSRSGENHTEKLHTLLKIIGEESSYPLQYILAGKNVDGLVLLLNQKLMEVAKAKGCKYVDIYDVSNENNIDPHPNAQVHKEIADILKAELSDTITYQMTGEKPAEKKSYTVQKISNPDRGEREVDGLIEGGDRENSYTWRLAQRGDDIYVATTRNIASALVNMYGGEFSKAGISLDTFWSMIDVVTNGDIPRNDANEGANIIRYNRKTGKFDVIYTAGTGDYFRMAVTFGDNVYFGSYSAVPTNPQYILKLDTDGNFTKVFETMGSVSLRANCVYDDHLFFAGADDRTEIAEGETAPVAKMAVLMKSNEDDTVWERVADFRDFGTTAYDPIHTSWAGAPIWELASHDGYIYATAPTHNGFVIYKGRPAEEGEDKNEYGWIWTEVAGMTNGINNPGLSDVEGGEPGTMRSLIGSVYEFNGELYAYNFDHSFGGEASAFAGMLQQVAGQDVKASEYLFYLYDSLHNPQKVWKLNDESGKFEELTAFTELMEGTTNEYVWRLGAYDGDLYVATMDAGIFYNYLTQLTNGSFFTMSKEERLQKLGYINNLLSLLADTKGNEVLESLKAKLEKIKSFLEGFEAETAIDENAYNDLMDLFNISVNFDEIIEMIKSGIDDGSISNIATTLYDNDDDGLAASGVTLNSAETGFAFDLLSDKDWKALLVDPETGSSIKADFNQLKQSIADAFTHKLDDIKTKVDEIIGKIDVKGLEMYAYINKAVMNDEWGFDMYRTSDGGKSFEIITQNGFGDKYNYGCPAFLETEEGLYFGTCNPFYGGQLYLLTNDSKQSDSYMLGDVDGDGIVSILDATYIQKKLASIPLTFEFHEKAADTDGDGSVSIIDATYIQKWLASLPSNDNIGKPI